MLKYKSIIITVFFLALGASSPAYAYQARCLSDQELDNISAGGFDVDLGAAYSFRASVFSQSNIASLMSVKGTISHTGVSNLNVFDSHNSVYQNATFQENITALIAQTGDILGTTINSTNFAEITSSIMGLDQANIVLVSALTGNIQDVTINNTNLANIQNVLTAPSTTETNISVLVAGGSIQNAVVNSANTAKVGNLSIPCSNLVKISSLPGGMAFDIGMNTGPHTSQTNLTFAFSGAHQNLGHLSHYHLNGITRIHW